MKTTTQILIAVSLATLIALGFAFLPSGTPRPPVHVVLLIDTSGSADSDVDLYRQAAYRIGISLRPKSDRLTIVRFDCNASEVSGPRVPANEEELLDLIDIATRTRSEQPLTRQEEGLGLAASLLEDSTLPVVIAVLSDGGHDDLSQHSFRQLETVASELRANDAIRKVIYAGTRVGNRELLRSRLAPLGDKLVLVELNDARSEVLSQ